MAQAEVARAPGVPWSLQLFQAAPLNPFWIGLALVAAILAVYSGLYFLLREIDPVFAGAEHERLPTDVRVAVINTLFFGYALAAQAWLEDATRRAIAQVRALHPDLDTSLSAAPFSPEAGRVAGVLGIALLASAVFGSTGTFRLWGDPGYWIYPHVWLVGQGC